MYLTENRLSRNVKVWCAADNHNYMCHISAKNFYFQILIQKLLKKA